MLIDSVLFFNELDLLEIRLRELGQYVDQFVIVEATTTHKGDAKPLYYSLNKERYAEWHNKIVHVVVSDMPEGDGLPAIRRREMFQRNAILRGIADAPDDAIVLISDVDEIPRISSLPADIPDGVVAVYDQTLYYYNLNTQSVNARWHGTRACRVADARALSPHIVRYGIGMPDPHYPLYVMIPNAGWHYSYFGDAEHIRTKMTQFLHQELVNDEHTDHEMIETRVKAGVDIWGRVDEQQFVIGPASDLPRAVLFDLPRWSHLFAEGWASAFHEDWYAGDQAVFMAELARRAPEGAIVEIGAWEGRSTTALAQVVAPRIVHVVDHWLGNLDEDPNHESRKIAVSRDVNRDFMRNMRLLTANNWTQYRQDWRDWIKIWNLPIAFLHLDAAHDERSVYDCLEAMKPFLVNGAILCGDDAYADSVQAGVKRALGERVRCVGGRLWVWQNGEHA